MFGFTLRSTTFVLSLAALVAMSASAGAQPSYKHKTQVRELSLIPVTATALAPASVAPAAVPSRETDGLSRNDEDCRFGCIDH